MFKPFDIVKVKETVEEEQGFSFPDGVLMPKEITAYGIVTTSQGHTASIVWFDDDNRPLKNAWWNESELTVCGNLFEIIANEMDCHNGQYNKKYLQGSMFMSTKGLEVKEEEIQRLNEKNDELRQELRNAKATIKKQEEYIKTLL